MAVMIIGRSYPWEEVWLAEAGREKMPESLACHPNACETEVGRLFGLAQAILQRLPQAQGYFNAWREELLRLQKDPELETLKGEGRLEALSLELRGLWLDLALRTVRDLLKSPPKEQEKRLPLGEMAKYEYERLVYPRNLERRCPRIRPVPAGWDPQHVGFSSGMAAIHGMLQSVFQIARGKREKGWKLDFFGGYFETKRVLEMFLGPGFQYQRHSDPMAFLASVRRGQGNILFLEPVSYDWQFGVVDPGSLVQAMEVHHGVELLVLDTTLLGPFFPMAELLESLTGPRAPLVVQVTSLLKLEQEGLELANAGVATLYLPMENTEAGRWGREVVETMQRQRKIVGNSLSMNAMAMLDAPWFLDPDGYAAHARDVYDNNRMLATLLAPLAGKGIFDRVFHPRVTQPEAPSWVQAPFVLVHFRPRQDLAPNHRLLVEVTLLASQILGLGLVEGSSFGFRSSRFEIIAPHGVLHPNGHQKGVLKIAMGRRQGPQRDAIFRWFIGLAGCRDFEVLQERMAVMKQRLAQRENRPRDRLQPGALLDQGRYQVEALLGEGVFGQVFRVREVATGDVLAMKRAVKVKDRRLFAAEVEKLTRLQGMPHVLPFRRHFLDEDGTMVLLTEYLDGGNLKEIILARGRLTQAQALGVLDQLTQALHAAHRLDPPILHRDIKPSNILGKRVGANRISWYLADWGLAAAWRDSSERTVSGTYSYTAPEVWEKKRYPVSDCYSLGMTLYFMLFGRPVYEGNSASIRQMQKDIQPVVVPSGCPARLKTLLEGMLAKDPLKRWSLEQVMTHLRGGGRRPGGGLTVQTRMPGGRLWRADVEGCSMEFSWIPPGSFQMGQSEGETLALQQRFGMERWQNSFARELPRHKVTLEGFWMGRTPVTRGQFECFVRDTGMKTLAEKEGWARVWDGESFVEKRGVSWRNPGFDQEADHPVVNVTWNDARAFARWLSRKVGRLMQLPTEAMWEYACRAGGDTMFGCGDVLGDHQANFDARIPFGLPDPVVGRFLGRTSSVTQFSSHANAWGLCDMHGNCFEWTRDCWQEGYYRFSPQREPFCEVGSRDLRVIRGGSWHTSAERVRSAFRDRFGQDNRDSDLGFRLVAMSHPWEC